MSSVFGIHKLKLALMLVVLSFNLGVPESLAQSPRVDNLSAEILTKILDRYRGKPYDSFSLFALDAYSTGQSLFTEEQHNAIGQFAANKRLKPQEAMLVYRLLGVYARLKYGGEARRMLAKLVSIPSVRQVGLESHNNAHFIRLQKTVAAYAKEFKLDYKNIDGRVYEVSLPSKGGVQIGLHTHGDIMPVDPDLWVLEDGTKLDPFKMTQVGNKLYGRGVVGSKNGIVASMIGMRTIKEEEIRLFNSVKLLIDTTGASQDVTASSAISYYFQKRAKPGYNITLDGSYPVASAELQSSSTQINDRQPTSRWLAALLDVASDNLDLPSEFALLSANSPMHSLPNDVQFGLAMPGDKHTGANANEFKTIDQFLLDLQIVTETIMLIGLMRSLD